MMNMFVCSEEEISANRPYYNPDTTSIKAPKGQGCPRCGGMVFAAEQQLAKGTVSFNFQYLENFFPLFNPIYKYLRVIFSYHRIPNEQSLIPNF